MGDQFCAFLWAVYCLYDEDRWSHLFYFRGIKEFKREHLRDTDETVTTNTVFGDEEGRYTKIDLTRKSKQTTPPANGEPDPVEINLDTFYGKFNYVIDGRDLCYAVARGCTEALKRYGFLGYQKSTGNQHLGDSFSINMLIFIKAYPLDAMEARNTTIAYSQPDGWMEAEKSCFENEIELLLFDM